MKRADLIPQKIFTPIEIVQKVAQWRVVEKKLHLPMVYLIFFIRGHIFSLSQAATEADYLIVGLNSDASVKRLKGESRPVNNEESRAFVLSFFNNGRCGRNF